jgi:hypothetical protein
MVHHIQVTACLGSAVQQSSDGRVELGCCAEMFPYQRHGGGLCNGVVATDDGESFVATECVLHLN